MQHASCVPEPHTHIIGAIKGKTSMKRKVNYADEPPLARQQKILHGLSVAQSFIVNGSNRQGIRVKMVFRMKNRI
jgi:hypothetical protein